LFATELKITDQNSKHNLCAISAAKLVVRGSTVFRSRDALRSDEQQRDVSRTAVI